MTKTRPDADQGFVTEAVVAVRECVTSYASYRQEENWYWHKNVKARGTHTKESEENLVLPTLEALWMFLEASSLKEIDSLETLIPNTLLVDDIALVARLAQSGFFADPYLPPIRLTETSFTETAGKFLSVVAAISRNTFLMDKIGKRDDGPEVQDQLLAGVTKAVDFILSSASVDQGSRYFWAATTDTVYQKKPDSPMMDLTHPYFTLCAVTGLFDILRRSGSIVDFKSQEKANIAKAISAGISGLNSLYRGEPAQFVDNLSNEANDVIPTVFALETILRIWDDVEIDKLKAFSRASITELVHFIQADLSGLNAFDRDADFKFQAKVSARGKAAIALDDHTTLGSVSNVLCLGLDRLPITDISEEYYAVMDGSVASLLARRDNKSKVWKSTESAIWYSSRAVEALVTYVNMRPVSRRTVTARELVGLVHSVIQSEAVLEAIAAEIREALESG